MLWSVSRTLSSIFFKSVLLTKLIVAQGFSASSAAPAASVVDRVVQTQLNTFLVVPENDISMHFAAEGGLGRDSVKPKVFDNIIAQFYFNSL